MSKRLTYLVGLSLFSTLLADNAQVEGMTPAISSIEPVAISLSTPEEPVFVKPPAPKRIEAERPFSPFTGKVKAKKVRLRANADLDSRVVKELNRNDLVVILGEKGDFYAVEPPQGSKAYVFRSFVLDGVVEGNRVNVRLEPSLDAPVIGHLNSGDRIKGVISSLNNKWYEISPPAGTRFFVAKEYIDSIGGVEVKAHLDKRRMAAEQLFDAATLLTQVEMKKSFREMDIERIKRNYQTMISDYVEFPELVDK
ncbi:MAG TPA: SH3 domain-containing protein, partial [Rhabdochlamydiaceae bacterium]|nr:SH3 domain-containing protein [Rhabdochlamydiaceae bacterium]